MKTVGSVCSTLLLLNDGPSTFLSLPGYFLRGTFVDGVLKEKGPRFDSLCSHLVALYSSLCCCRDGLEIVNATLIHSLYIHVLTCLPLCMVRRICNNQVELRVFRWARARSGPGCIQLAMRY